MLGVLEVASSEFAKQLGELPRQIIIVPDPILMCRVLLVKYFFN